jgi:hypothetical protein
VQPASCTTPTSATRFASWNTHRTEPASAGRSAHKPPRQSELPLHVQRKRYRHPRRGSQEHRASAVDSWPPRSLDRHATARLHVSLAAMQPALPQLRRRDQAHVHPPALLSAQPGAAIGATEPARRQNRGSRPEPLLRKAPAIAGMSASEFRLAVSGSQARGSHQDRTRTSEAPIRAPPPIRPARYGRAGAREQRGSSAGEAFAIAGRRAGPPPRPSGGGQGVGGGRIRLGVHVASLTAALRPSLG